MSSAEGSTTTSGPPLKATDTGDTSTTTGEAPSAIDKQDAGKVSQDADSESEADDQPFKEVQIADPFDMYLEAWTAEEENNPREKRRFAVNSHILCAASPVFRKMFGEDSPFAERRKLEESAKSFGKERPVFKVSDNAKYLQTILEALHFKSYSINASFTQSELVSLATIVDYYELCEALRPWSEKWVGRIEPDPSKENGIEPLQYSKVVKSCYLFGLGRELRLMASYLIENASLAVEEDNRRLRFRVQGKAYKFPAFHVEPIYEQIYSIRQSMISAATKEVDDFISSLALRNDPSHTLCSHRNDAAIVRATCDAAQLGSLIRNGRRLGYLAKESLLADPNSEFWDSSLSFHNIVQKFSTISMDVSPHSYSYDSGLCHWPAKLSLKLESIRKRSAEFAEKLKTKDETVRERRAQQGDIGA